MPTCKIHGDKALRNEGDGPYCQLCFEAAGEDTVVCDGPQCECSYECERMVNHQRYASTENISDDLCREDGHEGSKECPWCDGSGSRLLSHGGPVRCAHPFHNQN